MGNEPVNDGLHECAGYKAYILLIFQLNLVESLELLIFAPLKNYGEVAQMVRAQDS